MTMKKNNQKKPTRLVLVYREYGFYPLKLPVGENLEEHAKRNPGTLKILDAATGEVLWNP